jgi:hypothetical protein
MFESEGLDVLYVTSIGIDLSAGKVQPEAGSLFAFTELAITGLPQPRFAG